MLSPGDRLGPYEVVSTLGAGGMGEVYRARDTRLGREVALKVLPEDRSSDPDRLRRFETEARAVASLDHPHILALYDVGTHDGVPYAVTELLEGRTLRRVLEQGPLPCRKVVEYGVQTCRGLAAAHERGVVHRDVKPENLFLTREGQIKILDFGLAKLTEAGEREDADVSERPTVTESGVVMGTAAYMSPEQARGRPADARSDLFSLGAVLYEMLSGRRAFSGDTAADTVSSILNHDPPEITSGVGPVPTGLERVVRRCLEKTPQERFRSALDVAFALDALSGTSGVEVATPPEVERGGRPWLPRLAVPLVLLVSAGGAWFLGRSSSERPFPTIHQLTYRRGMVDGARFVPGGSSLLYTGLWDGQPPEIFQIRVDDAESTPLGLPHARLLAVSSRAELAVLLGRDDDSGFMETGTLARVPLSGGSPRLVLENAVAADWSPDGRELAVLRTDGRWSASPRLEYPIGTVLLAALEGYRPWQTGLRVSPQGDRVAVGLRNGILLVDRSGRQTLLEGPPGPGSGTQGLAWDPSGRVIWFGHCAPEPNCGIWQISLDGERHEVHRAASLRWLHDVSTDRRVLIHHGVERQGIRVKPPGEAAERELNLHGMGNPLDLSADGRQVLTGEDYRGSRETEAAYLRPTRGGPATRLNVGSGSRPVSLSPDGRWTLNMSANPNRLTLTPTGAGDPRDIPTERFDTLFRVAFAGNEHIKLVASEPGQPYRGWLRKLEGGDWSPVTPEGVAPIWVRWPQREVVGLDWAERTWAAYRLGGGPPRTLHAIPKDLAPLQHGTADGRFGLMSGQGVPTVIERVDLDTGERVVWRKLQPEDTAGVAFTTQVVARPDVDSYAYSYVRLLQDLYLIEGLE